MKYRIVFYCPDHHITYNLRTLEEVGVGGGITSRIRMAHALARLGHSVTVYVNCPSDEEIEGVEYRHYTEASDLQADILIVSTSGGKLDLASLSAIRTDARLRILMVHGESFPAFIHPAEFDFIYAPSNFIREIAITNWQVSPRKLFVSHRGVENYQITQPRLAVRDPFKLVYFGHPSKGLDAAVEVLRILHRTNPRFALHVYGGNRLWGMTDGDIPIEEGVFYHGMVGQSELAARLPEMNFSLNLQARQEPFGMVITESLQAGCIVLASPVGAFPEIIQDGWNGFLIPGLHTEHHTHELAARQITQLFQHPADMENIRMNAFHSPASWDSIALSWTEHWDYVIGVKPMIPRLYGNQGVRLCMECSGECLALIDGDHCLKCGYFRKIQHLEEARLKASRMSVSYGNR
jgi:glycosyltransferase involved in cell wall biosynthesis